MAETVNTAELDVRQACGRFSVTGRAYQTGCPEILSLRCRWGLREDPDTFLAVIDLPEDRAEVAAELRALAGWLSPEVDLGEVGADVATDGRTDLSPGPSPAGKGDDDITSVEVEG